MESQHKKRQITKKPVAKIVKQRPPSIRMYRRIAFSFLILTFLLLVLVGYLSFAQAKIIIYPNPKIITTEFNVGIIASPESETEVEGRIIEQNFEKTKEFISTGETKIVSGRAGGEVKIINNWNKDQPLVATTRLLSSDGVLFRLDQTVTVPAGGEIVSMVHADQEGRQAEIGPTRFTIPGLWEGLQDKIYAVSEKPMTGGEKEVSVIGEEDLNSAVEGLSQEILDQAKKVLTDSMIDPRLDGQAFSYEVLEKVSDTMPNQEKETFTIKIKIKVVAVFFNSVQMDEIIQAKLDEVLDTDSRLGLIRPEDITYAINRYNLDENVASLKVFAQADAIIKENSRALDKSKIAGLSIDDAILYLTSLSGVERVEVSARPFWIKMIPRLEDHIEYEIIYP